MDFTTRYDSLNVNQRRAVDHIHGPLLVLAGPGTGKTELLSMRAANILRQTDTLPSNILCLTFTDSGAANMRERLRSIIGADAYKVAIHTFHSFGTDIIGRNREYFFRGAEARPTDELTQYQLLARLFDQLDWKSPLASKNHDEYVHLRDVQRTISEFKQSGLTPDELRQIHADNQRIINELVPEIRAIFTGRISKTTIETFAPLAQTASQLVDATLPTGISPYTGRIALSIAHTAQEAIDTNSTKPITAWKNAWCEKDEQGEFTLKDARHAEKFAATIDLYEAYVAALAEHDLFDYDDMILSVLQATREHPDLAANLREQYQFVMVDEFQDTNLAQLRLLFALTGEGRDANVMAVGDDDQAIFSFQGAEIGNIQRFREQYDDPDIIVLTDNYRSDDKILTAARQVITQGQDRLENTIADLSKQLTAHAGSDNAHVAVREYATPSEERAGVTTQIAELIRNGTNPEHIAVLARRHNELIELLPYFAKHDIHVNYERHDDVLEQDIVRLLELLSRVVVAMARGELDTANARLPELVAHPAFGFTPGDIWRVSLSAWRNKTLWLETMQADSAFTEFANWLIERAASASTEPLETQLDAFVAKMHDYFFSPDKMREQPDVYLTALDSLRTLRDKIRDHYETTTPWLEQLIEFIDLHRTMNARITTTRPSADTATGAINLMSAHKAKGLEFPHVFVIGAIDSAWGERVRSRSRLIRYPANLPLEPAGATYDERLRLFFVAMTRAKTTLHISYARTDDKGKETLIASFLSAATPDVIPPVDLTEQTAIAETDWRAPLTAPITDDLRTLLAPTLERYKLSATHLNNFLDISNGGPQTFLLNNLLRFPQAKSTSATYGTAIHAALQFAHNSVRVDGALPDREKIFAEFDMTLRKGQLSAAEYAEFAERGRAALGAFLDAKASTFTRTQLTELNFAGQGVVIDDAQLTGALDLVDLDTSAKTIFITDYKTGKSAAAWRGSTEYEKIKLYKYRQQLMFYQLLVENSRDYAGYAFTGGRLQFVEPSQRTGEILALEDTFSDEELAEFRQLIGIVWSNIIALELPDISTYEPTLKGILAFEKDLLENQP